MTKGFCEYCGKKLSDPSNIRCRDCNKIWQDGYKGGRKSVKSTLKEIFQHLANLVNLENE